MKDIYQIYLISDSTGETLDRIFLALQAQFSNFNYKTHQYSFIRTENQVDRVISKCEKEENIIILYTIVDNSLSKYLINKSNNKKIPCYGVLGNLILSFSKLLNQRASMKPSGQHVLDEDYYDRIEAIQFTMAHDDGKATEDIEQSDIILMGVSRTSKTPTSVYLANRGYKISNIPIIQNSALPEKISKNPNISCIVGLVADPTRLAEVRKNRIASLHEEKSTPYTNIENISLETEDAKNLFKKHGWPIIDVSRKSVEEIAASIIKIYDIKKSNVK